MEMEEQKERPLTGGISQSSISKEKEEKNS
jgi:hypothetical protein